MESWEMEMYYINLDHRTDRKELMHENWQNKVSLQRVKATEISGNQFGTEGCYESHHKVLKVLALDSYLIDLAIIAEDDIIPSSSFNNKLEVILNEIPQDWDILMLGHSTTERSKFHYVINNICKATDHVLSGTCYIVNPNFYQTLLEEYKNEYYESNFDLLLMNIQRKYNVYMAMPSLCYQYQSYSDNSKMTLDNTELTKTYFKD